MNLFISFLIVPLALSSEAEFGQELGIFVDSYTVVTVLNSVSRELRSANPCEVKKLKIIEAANSLIKFGSSERLADIVKLTDIAWRLIDWADQDIDRSCLESITVLRYNLLRRGVKGFVDSVEDEESRSGIMRLLASQFIEIFEAEKISEELAGGFWRAAAEEFGKQITEFSARLKVWLDDLYARIKFSQNPFLEEFRAFIAKIETEKNSAKTEENLIGMAQTLLPNDQRNPGWKVRAVWRWLDLGIAKLTKKFDWIKTTISNRFSELKLFIQNNILKDISLGKQEEMLELAGWLIGQIWDADHVQDSIIETFCAKLKEIDSGISDANINKFAGIVRAVYSRSLLALRHHVENSPVVDRIEFEDELIDLAQNFLRENHSSNYALTVMWTWFLPGLEKAIAFTGKDSCDAIVDHHILRIQFFKTTEDLPLLVSLKRFCRKAESADKSEDPASAEDALVAAAHQLLTTGDSPYGKFKKVWSILDDGLEKLDKKFGPWVRSEFALRYILLKNFVSHRSNFMRFFNQLVRMESRDEVFNLIGNLGSEEVEVISDIVEFPTHPYVREMRNLESKSEDDLVELSAKILEENEMFFGSKARLVWQLLSWGIAQLRGRNIPPSKDRFVIKYNRMREYVLSRRPAHEFAFYQLSLSLRENGDEGDHSRVLAKLENVEEARELIRMAVFDPVKKLEEVKRNLVSETMDPQRAEAMMIQELDLYLREGYHWEYARMWEVMDAGIVLMERIGGKKHESWKGILGVDFYNFLRNILRPFVEKNSEIFVKLFRKIAYSFGNDIYASQISFPPEIPLDVAEVIESTYRYHQQLYRLEFSRKLPLFLHSLYPRQGWPVRKPFVPSKPEGELHPLIDTLLTQRMEEDLKYSSELAPWLIFDRDRYLKDGSVIELEIGRSLFKGPDALVFIIKSEDRVVKYQTNCGRLGEKIPDLYRDYWFQEIVSKFKISPNVYWLSPPEKFQPFIREDLGFQIDRAAWWDCARDPRSQLRFMVMDRVEYTANRLPELIHDDGQLFLQSIRLGIHLIEKLKTMHNLPQPVIHGDVHDGNVGIKNNEVFLIDFGRAAFEAEHFQDQVQPASRRHCWRTHYAYEGWRAGFRDDVHQALLTVAYVMSRRVVHHYCWYLVQQPRDDNLDLIDFHKNHFIFDIPEKVGETAHFTGRFKDVVASCLRGIPVEQRIEIRGHLKAILTKARGVRNVRIRPDYDAILGHLRAILDILVIHRKIV